MTNSRGLMPLQSICKTPFCGLAGVLCGDDHEDERGAAGAVPGLLPMPGLRHAGEGRGAALPLLAPPHLPQRQVWQPVRSFTHVSTDSAVQE